MRLLLKYKYDEIISKFIIPTLIIKNQTHFETLSS